MTIITRQRSDNFAIIPNAVAEDNRLSFTARGLLVYLLAKPNNWQVKISDIRSSGGIGRDQAYKLLGELKAAGYIEIEKKRTAPGTFASHNYVVYDNAVPGNLPLPENKEVDTPLTENAEVVQPLPDLPDTENPHPVNTDAIIRTQSLTRTQSPTITQEETPARATSAARAFEQFWAIFPNKVGKRDAETAFARAIKRAPVEAIMAGLTRYAAKADDRPWCNPATFLNQDRWTDMPAPAVARVQPPKKLTQGNMWHDEAKQRGIIPDEYTGETIDLPATRVEGRTGEGPIIAELFAFADRRGS